MLRRTGAFGVAAAGGAVALVSLWLPWYAFGIPAALIEAARAAGRPLGIGAPDPGLGSAHLSAWQALQQGNTVFAIAAIAIVGFAALGFARRGSEAGRAIAAAGTVIVCLSAHRMVVPPGPAALLHPAWGAFVALAGGGLALAGGIVAHVAERRPVGARR